MSAHFQEPFLSLWMTTRTLETQAVGPLEVTWPETRLFGSNLNETVRATGAVVTVKSVALVAVPPGVVRETLPVVAPVGTVAVTEVAVLAPIVVAAIPLNLTEVTPSRFVPVMATLVPTGPEVGVNDVIVGAAAKVKLVALLAVPLGVVTCKAPVVAPTGTVAVIAKPDAATV